MTSRQAAWCAVVLAVAVAYFRAPDGGVAQAVLFSGLSCAAVALLAVRVRRTPAFAARPRILLAGAALYATATALWAGIPLLRDEPLPFPSVVDGLYFVSYAFVGLFLYRLVADAGDPDRAVVLDAFVVAAGIAALAWPYLVEPQLTAPGVSALARATALGYPLAQLVLFALVVRFDLLAPVRTSAHALLALWIAAELGADAVYGALSVDGSFYFGHPASVGWILSYAALGALALDPRLDAVGRRSAGDRPPVTRRLVFLGVAALAPLVTLVASENARRNQVVVVAASASASFAVVIYRMSRLTVDALAQRRLKERLGLLASELRDQAFRDPLTGIGNRALFSELLEHAFAHRHETGRTVAVLLLDLDGFRWVNDTRGHGAGDSLLEDVARRLLDTVRAGDTVARLGGDEFVVLFRDIDRRMALHVADRVQRELRRPVDIAGGAVQPTASIGVAFAEPEDDPDSLVRHADVAMYAAKAAGGGRWEVFDPVRHSAILRRQRLEVELRDCAQRGELVLHYQPVFELASRRLLGCEALVRWRHPDLGFLEPSRFIDIAEDSGAIVPVGMWVLEEACRQGLAWAESSDAALHMSVNVSRRQLRDPGFVDEVREVLDRTAFPVENLVLEITETALMNDTDAMLAVLWKLKALGVTLSMDDFGTGYSSLGELRRLPIDVVKLDRGFIEGVAKEQQEWSLIVAILQLATTLGKQTLAEGIEQPGQLAHLRSLGCEMGQGFLLATPMAVADFEDFLRGPAGARLGEVR